MCIMSRIIYRLLNRASRLQESAQLHTNLTSEGLARKRLLNPGEMKTAKKAAIIKYLC